MRGISILLALMLISGLTFAATIHVGPNQPWTTIQAGINATVSGDTVIVEDGVYTGSGNKNLDFAGRNIVLMSETGPENCVIDCENSGRGFYFHSGETSQTQVVGITVINGSNTMGGGVNIVNSNPTFKRCIIAGNLSSASYGGAAYIANCSPTFENCTIYGNAAKYGGGIYAANSDLIVNSCIIAGNVLDGC